jgi:hemerythrin-like domain-containing protein/rubredoxin
MLPIGPLMVEHRLIERMIRLLEQEAKRIRVSGKVDTDFVLSAIDFIRLYADRCHHGKEEEILFRELKRKPLSEAHRRIMEELEAEHVQGRRTVARLALLRERVLKGEAAAARDLTVLLEELVRFYPAHIEKEDHRFFLPCMDYFTEEEKTRMLEEGQDFDRALLHDYYGQMMERREGKPPTTAPGAVELEGAAGTRYGCMVCGYTYDPRHGEATQGVPPGTPFANLPEGWICPHCHVSSRMFLPLRT